METEVGDSAEAPAAAPAATSEGVGSQKWRGTQLSSLRGPSNLVTSWASEAATRVLTCLTNQDPDTQVPGRVASS